MIRELERLTRSGVYDELGVEQWQRTTRAWSKRKRSYQWLAFERQQLAAIYGPDHAYTRTGTLAPGSIDKIGPYALTSFRDEHYRAANATLVVAGNFDPRRTEALIRDTFGSWSKGHKDPPVPRATNRRAGPVHVGVIGSDNPQVDVAILYPSPPGIAGEQAARLVLTRMLNEQMARIRSKLGATYGTYARRDAHLGASVYHLEGAVDAPRAGEALRTMRAGIDALRAGNNFDALFAAARRKVVQELIGGSAISTELASRLGQTARFGLDPDYDNDLLRRAAALSPAEVRRLLATELSPEAEVVVLLGDRAAVTRAFAEAGIDDARLVVPDDN
jgi:zinc protease